MSEVIISNLDVWSSALLRKSTAGRGSNGKHEAHGIKKLRELILELAVRGKLVPQDPNEEPAVVLLESVAKERNRLLKDGLIKKQKEVSDPPDQRKPFALPQGWHWVALSQLGVFSGGKTPSKMKSAYWNGDIPWVTPKDMKVLQISDTEDHVTEAAINDGLELFEPESVLFVVRSGILRRTFPVALAKVRCTVNQDLKVLSLFDTDLAPYVVLMMRGFERYILKNLTKTGMTVESVLFDEFATHYFMLPPLAEQHRIVAKVNELMALCDQLEKRQTGNIEDHQTLVETLLSTLTRAASPQELTEAWTRIVTHFDTLLTTENSIDELKETILQLAVMGKLVPQDPNDEPVSVLLEKIARKREELVQDGRLKKQSSIPDVTKDEMAFELPPGWEFVRFGVVTFNRDAERVPLSVEERRGRRGEYDYYGASGVIDSIDDFLFDKPLLLIGEDGANLINRSTPIAFMARGKYWVNNHAHVLDGLTEELLLFVCLHINAISLEPYVTGTAQPKMNQAKMNSIVLALPPMEEQKRIVAKVDELMVLCDALKARVSDLQATQVHLADAIVEQVVA